MNYRVTRYSFSSITAQTRFWWTEKVCKEIGKLDSSKRNLLMKRIKRYTENGFRNYVGLGGPIKLEKDGVYRIGHSDDLFRIIGFFENNTGGDFLAMEAFRKKGQKLTTSQQEKVDQVVRARRKGSWEKTQ